jgi:hypothetical protein
MHETAKSTLHMCLEPFDVRKTVFTCGALPAPLTLHPSWVLSKDGKHPRGKVIFPSTTTIFDLPPITQFLNHAWQCVFG